MRARLLVWPALAGALGGIACALQGTPSLNLLRAAVARIH